MIGDDFIQRLKTRNKKHGFEKIFNHSTGCWIIRERQTGLCPVCAVAEDVNGFLIKNDEVTHAARKLNLNWDFLTEVMLESDGFSMPDELYFLVA